MEAATDLKQERVRPAWIAPRWHTAIVLMLVVGFAALAAVGGRMQSAMPGAAAQDRAAGYAFATALEWLMAGVVWWGVRLRKGTVRELIGGRWNSGAAVLRDLGIAALFLVASNVVSAVLTRLLAVDTSQVLRQMIPRSRAEAALYLLMALTAGFCEEIVFRGYLQKQFAAVTGNAGAAVAAQGFLFAVFHGNQGWRFMVTIATYGWLLGALAYWRRSVRPGMIAHFAQDGLVGLLARYLVNR